MSIVRETNYPVSDCGKRLKVVVKRHLLTGVPRELEVTVPAPAVHGQSHGTFFTFISNAVASSKDIEIYVTVLTKSKDSNVC